MPSESDKYKRGPGGRPTREEAERRHQSLLSTATRLFLEKGWERASVDEISRDAKVAKRFIYARYPDKAALFVGAVEHFISGKMDHLHHFEPLPETVEDGLYSFGRTLLDLGLHPETLALLRLFIAEAPRFPDLAKRSFDKIRHRGHAEINRVLAAYASRGAIAIDDPEITAEQFFMLVVGMPQRLALLGAKESRETTNRRLRAAVHLFLEGCRRR